MPETPGSRGRVDEKRKRAAASFSEALISFIVTRRKVLLGLLVLILAGALMYGGFEALRTNRSKKAASVLEALDEKFSLLDREELSAEESTERTELLDALSELAEEYPSSFAAHKALLLRAHYFARQGDNEVAYKAYEFVFREAPHTFVAAIALSSMAKLKEEDAEEEALVLWETLVTNYKEWSFLIPEALVRLGRLHEKHNKEKEALDVYRRVVTTEKTGLWHALSMSRIVAIESGHILWSASQEETEDS